MIDLTMTEEATRREQEQQFEEELRKACRPQTTEELHDGNEEKDDELHDGEYESREDEETEEEYCRHCQRFMSHLRKSAVRWLYMEWYKKAVLGLHLPTVSFFFNVNV